MNCLFDPACIPKMITINKLKFVPKQVVSGVAVLKLQRSGYGQVGCLAHVLLFLSCIGLPVSPIVQLIPNFFVPLMKTTSFLYYFSEKNISIDRIPPILQAFKVVISCPTTEHGGIWVGPLLTSSKDMAQNTQATFDWVSNAVKTYLGYLCFISYLVIF